MKKRMLILSMITMLTVSSLVSCGNGDSSEIEELMERIERLEEENEELRGKVGGQDNNIFHNVGDNMVADDLFDGVNKSTAEAWGACGADLNWYYMNNILYIRGTGDMEDYYHTTNGTDFNAPWLDYRGGINRVIIEDGCTSIGNDAFYGWFCYFQINKVVIPNTVTRIGDRAFHEVLGLEEIDLPDSVTYIGSEAFVACHDLSKINIPDSVTYIGDDAFSGCCITEIVIPDNVSYMGVSLKHNKKKEIDYYTCFALQGMNEQADESAVSIEWRGQTYYSIEDFTNAYVEVNGVDY